MPYAGGNVMKPKPRPPNSLKSCLVNEIGLFQLKCDKKVAIIWYAGSGLIKLDTI